VPVRHSKSQQKFRKTLLLPKGEKPTSGGSPTFMREVVNPRRCKVGWKDLSSTKCRLDLPTARVVKRGPIRVSQTTKDR